MKTINHVISSPILRTNGITQWISRINHYYQQQGWCVRIITDAVTPECPPELMPYVVTAQAPQPHRPIPPEGIGFSEHCHHQLVKLVGDSPADVTYTHSVEAQRACQDTNTPHRHCLHTADIIAGERVSMLSSRLVTQEITYMKHPLCEVITGTQALADILKHRHGITAGVMRYPIPDWLFWPRIQPQARRGVLYMGSDDYRKRPHLARELARELGEPLTAYTTGTGDVWGPGTTIGDVGGLTADARMWDTLRYRVCHIPSEAETVCWVAIEQQLQQPVLVRANTCWSTSAEELGCLTYTNTSEVQQLLTSVDDTKRCAHIDDYLTQAHTQWHKETQ